MRVISDKNRHKPLVLWREGMTPLANALERQLC
jgi:hypothetical protein